MKSKSSQWIPGWISCLKLLTTIFCVVGFILNSLVICRHFMERKTITSINKELHSALHFPSITLCNHIAFKQRITSFDYLEIENFRNNTIELKDLILSIQIFSADSVLLNDLDIQDNFNGESYQSDSWSISTVYSKYRGRCFTMEYLKQVFFCYTNLNYQMVSIWNFLDLWILFNIK